MKKGLLFIITLVFIAFSVNAQKSIVSNYEGGTYIGAGTSKDFVTLYEQLDAPGTGYSSQDFETTYDQYDAFLSDEFIVPAGETWDIDSVALIGSWNGGVPLSEVHIFFWNDDAGGVPGTEITSFMNTACTTDDLGGNGTSQVLLPSRVTLTEGTYWIGFQARQDIGTDGQWYWTINSPTTGYEAHWKNPLDGFATGYVDWTAAGTVWGASPDLDLTFGLYEILGIVVPAPITFLVDNTANTSYTGFSVKGSWDAGGNFDDTWSGGNTMMYDDGTNGDVTADDDIWTAVLNLVPDAGANTWEWGVNDQDDGWIDGNWEFTVPDETAQELSYSTVGVNSISAENINIYPNPSNGTFNVNVESNYDLEVLDITGKVINFQVLTGNSTVEINTAGVYFLRFSNEEGSVTQRVIVQ